MPDQELIAKLRECANLLGGNTLLLLAAARIEELTDKELEPRVLDLEHALAQMIFQYCRDSDGTYVTHLCMEAGETAFALLGMEDYTSIEELDDLIQRQENEMWDMFDRRPRCER